jgi:RHS repeat-associated protein
VIGLSESGRPATARAGEASGGRYDSGRDADGRRIVKAIDNAGDWDATYHYLYEGRRPVEIQNGTMEVLQQFAWGLEYLDELLQVAVNEDYTSDDDCDDASYYAVQDAHWNTIGLVDSDGDLIERYEQTPFGEREIFRSRGSADALCSVPAGESQRVILSSGASAAWSLCPVGHQGLFYDKEFNTHHNRGRDYSPRLRRYAQRDRIGYIDGNSLYEAYACAPWSYVDPMGTSIWSTGAEIGGWLYLYPFKSTQAVFEAARHSTDNKAVRIAAGSLHKYTGMLSPAAGADYITSVAAAAKVVAQKPELLGRDDAHAQALHNELVSLLMPAWFTVTPVLDTVAEEYDERKWHSFVTDTVRALAGKDMTTPKNRAGGFLAVADYRRHILPANDEAQAVVALDAAAINAAKLVTIWRCAKADARQAAARTRNGTTSQARGSASTMKPGRQVRTVGELRAAGGKDAHHVIQEAAVKNLPRYDSNAAPGAHLPGPSTAKGTPHYRATQVQRQAGGGTYGAERRIAYKALRRAGLSPVDARRIIQQTDAYFGSIGVDPATSTRIPGNRGQ